MFFYNNLLFFVGVKFTGKPKYIGYHVVFDDFSKITLGDKIVISDHCHLLTHDFSITTGLISIGKEPDEDIPINREINIKDNVFIGKKSIIMPGCTISENVIIGAGSVIRGKIEADSIVIGNPAKKVKSLKDYAHNYLSGTTDE
tara:strand:+ start:100 stop:531 length:432 start_codon:yes stop_codon:yes gene_type:complete